MRRLLVIILVLVGVLVAVALLAPVLIPSDFLRDRLSAQSSERLGREVRLDGEVGLSILPRVQARAGQVSVANAEGFGEQPLAEMAEMRFTLALWPLLTRQIVIEEFVLVEPVIRLEQRGARNNWTFRETAAGAPAAPDGGFVRRPGALPFEASFGDVRIVDGALSYTADGETREVRDLDLQADLPSLDAPARLRGGFTADGEAIDFTLEAGSVRGLFEGARTPVALDLDSDMAEIAFDGALLESERFDYDGRADVSLALRRLARFLGSELPDGDGFRRFDADAEIAGRQGRITLSDAEIALDDIAAAGDLVINHGEGRPAVNAQLDIPALDLNPYLPAGGEDANSGAMEPWSDEPVDLGPLSLVDAAVDAAVGRLRVRDIEVTDVTLRAVLANGRLQADLEDFLLYGGRGSAVAVANTRSATPSFSLDAELDALDALPFLRAAANFERLEGLGSINLDLAASGASPAAIMDSISGQGGFSFEDGAIKGANLAQVVRTIQTAVETGELPSGFGERQQTDFTALAGTIAIENGLARNTDLLMLSPLLRVRGDGEVSLAEQRIDYRINPRAVGSLTGQGGDVDLQGLEVPIRIRGGFNDVSIGVDFEAVARDLVRARAGELIGGEAGQALGEGRSIEDVAAEALLDRLMGRDEDDASSETPGETEADTEPAAETDSEDPAIEVPGPARSILEGLLSGALGEEQPEETEEPPSDG
ncbi:AsmA family protein [Marinicauda salina]|nr:AsmA family protein [Marinicauda salina]